MEGGPLYIGIKHASKQKEYGNLLNLLAFYHLLVSYGRRQDSLLTFKESIKDSARFPVL